MRRELLVLQFLVHVSARHVEVPFYACVGGNGQPGICAYFESHVQPVNVSRDAFSFQEGLAACKSDALHPLFNAMRKSVLEWDETICAEYLHSFIEAELKSREIARPTRIRSAQTLIDAVNVIAARTNSLVEGSIAQHSFNDGQAIDEALKQKRTCLITAMASALPPRQDKYSRIAEIGFNVGHSAAMLLTALPRASVTSFDICSWPYTRESAKFLRSNIKNGTKRLQLVCGDSRESLAQYDPLRVGGGMEEDEEATDAMEKDEANEMDDGLAGDGGDEEVPRLGLGLRGVEERPRLRLGPHAREALRELGVHRAQEQEVLGRHLVGRLPLGASDDRREELAEEEDEETLVATRAQGVGRVLGHEALGGEHVPDGIADRHVDRRALAALRTGWHTA